MWLKSALSHILIIAAATLISASANVEDHRADDNTIVAAPGLAGLH